MKYRPGRFLGKVAGNEVGGLPFAVERLAQAFPSHLNFSVAAGRFNFVHQAHGLVMEVVHSSHRSTTLACWVPNSTMVSKRVSGGGLSGREHPGSDRAGLLSLHRCVSLHCIAL